MRLYAVSVHTAGERRAARAFPLVSLWALAQRDCAIIAPSIGITGVDEAKMWAVLSRLMRTRLVGVLGHVPRFFFT